jgi:putative ABC transport system substrate-binding protein
MNRRKLLKLAGAATASLWSGAAPAQQAAKIPRVGVLLYSDPNDATVEAVRRDLAGLGHVEGKNIAFEYRYASGRPERLPKLGLELVALKPDILLALGGDVVSHLYDVTKSIPLVFAISSDPVRQGLIESFARPGGNATGVTFLQDSLASKRLALLKEATPKISRVGFLFNPLHLDNELREAERAASAVGANLVPAAIRGPDDLANAFEGATQAGVDSLYVVSSRQTVSNVAKIVDFSRKNRLPAAGGWGAWAQAGALISYGPDTLEVTRQTAVFIDKILKGAKPAELPAQQPTRFELIVNLKTAKELGIVIPEAFLLRADRLIE